MASQRWKDGETGKGARCPADYTQSRGNRPNSLYRFGARKRGKGERSRVRQEADGHGPNTRHRNSSSQGRSIQRTRRDTHPRSKDSPWERHGRENPRKEREEPKKLTLALAGNANVGKSVIFNQLTGLHQHIGNWPGKTVEKAEGTLYFEGYLIDVIDLPGIYSLSTFSIEEVISREYIASERPDVVVNVVDASVLERNLFFTLQLIELGASVVVALNQIDIAAKKGIEIDHEKLAKILGVPVVPTVAIKGTGVYNLLEKAVDITEKRGMKPSKIEYGGEIEERISELAKLIELAGFRKYPARWTAIKLLEGDEEIERQINEAAPRISETARRLVQEVEELHGHSCETVVTSERYETARCIVNQVQQIDPTARQTLTERVHELTTHSVYGYVIMLGVLLSVFYTIFTFGDMVSEHLGILLYGVEPVFVEALGRGIVKSLIWGGIMEGVIAGVTVALPYILPFYLVLYLLEDSGYLSRIAFLMDAVMHKIGLHGKAFIPFMLSFGCNVPACLGCRIMETERERLLATFVVTMVPCAAVTVVVLGLVGRYVGVQWAMALYIVDLAIVLALGRIAFKALPGEPTGLIMEMNEYRVPHLKTVLTQTWFRLREFILLAFPLIILSGLAIELIELAGLLQPIVSIMSPVTVDWLGLRLEMGIPLLFGLLRKELTLIMLAALIKPDLAALTSAQMVVFTIVVMLYIPCAATVAALVKEAGWRKAAFITAFEVLFALLVGGVIFRILSLFGLP